MKKVLINFAIICMLFNNIIFNVFKMPSIVNYWDEFLEIFIILLGLLSLKNKIKKSYFISILIIACILICGLAGNLLFNYVSMNSYIIRDLLCFLKFPISFLILKTYNYDEKISKYISKGFVYFIKIMIIVMFACAIISLFVDIGMTQDEIRHGIHSYQFLFLHPTYLVLTSLFLLLFLDSNCEKNKNNYLYNIMIIIIVILTMRTKGIALVSLYIFMKYAGAWVRKAKIIYWVGASIVLYMASIKKIQLYASYASSPREVLYKGSILLSNKSFPFGSGFASYASHISSKSNSRVYEFIKIPYYWVENGNQYAVLGDAGFAYYIGQFGYFGFALFIYLMIRLYKLSTNKIENKFPIQILWLYVAIALTSESILLNNGIELCLMFLLLCGLNKQGKAEEIKK